MKHFQAGDYKQLPPTIKSDEVKGKAKVAEQKNKSIIGKIGKVKDPESSKTDTEGVTSKAIPTVHINPKSKLKIPKSLATTMFDRLMEMYGNKICRMLTVQYR